MALKKNCTFKEIEEIIKKVDLHIDELHHAYQQYFTRVEKIPPEKKRKALENLVSILRQKEYPPKLQFKISKVLNRFNTYKNLWDKRLEMFFEYGTISSTRIREIREGKLNQKPKEKEIATKDEIEEKKEFVLNNVPDDKLVKDLSIEILKEANKKGSSISDVTVIEKAVQSKIKTLKEKFGKDKDIILDFEIKEGKLKFKAKIKKK